jgi:hypothetical protein
VRGWFLFKLCHLVFRGRQLSDRLQTLVSIQILPSHFPAALPRGCAERLGRSGDCFIIFLRLRRRFQIEREIDCFHCFNLFRRSRGRRSLKNKVKTRTENRRLSSHQSGRAAEGCHRIDVLKNNDRRFL